VPESEGRHPAALPILFFAEMWERFCFYGMRALLVLYMTKGFLGYGDDKAYEVYGSYNSFVYLTPILGGLLADRLLGYRRSIFLGGILMAVGEFMLLIQNILFFYGGLAFIIVGNGYFKPNISTLLGKLYKEGDPKRDAGFGIFYMGINIGALSSTLICGWIGENIGWPYGFAVAGLGMLAGLVVFGMGKQKLHGHGEIPDQGQYKRWAFPVLIGSIAVVPVIAFMLQTEGLVFQLLVVSAVGVLGYLFWTSLKEDKIQRHRMWVILVLVFFHTVFWAFFEQAGSSLTLFTDRNVDRDLFGWEFPTTWGQFFNPFFIVVLTPVFAWLWPFLSRIGKNPSIPNKFTLGIFQVGLGFGALVLAAQFAVDGKTSLAFLVLCYLLHTTGELCLSPVGLSMVTKLSPARMTGLVMGAWFLSIAFAHSIAAWIAGLTGGAGEAIGQELDALKTLGVYTDVFAKIGLTAVGVALLLLVISPILKRWLHGVE
jgi:POT family proton-dependent oligopeptide transporter